MTSQDIIQLDAPASAPHHVAAVVATFGRPRELERLLQSLSGVHTVFICDNSAGPDIHRIVENSTVAAHHIAPHRNLGCGGGLRAAEELAWQTVGDRLTHLLVLDDDAVLEPETVPILAAAMEQENAVAAYPLITGADGSVGWTPGLRDERLHRLGRNPTEPSQYRAALGVSIADFDWAQGICLLVRSDAVEQAGFHRGDFWVRGEDLDFSLRLTARGRGIFVPAATAQHLPPTPAGGGEGAECLRHAAMVQNIAFLALRQSHGASLRGSLAGASRRFLSLWGLGAVPDLARAFWRGGVLAQPAGTGSGRTFLRRFDEFAA